MMTLLFLATVLFMTPAFVLPKLEKRRQLARLRELLGAPPERHATAALIGEAAFYVERLLPNPVARNLRRLGVQVEPRHVALAAAGTATAFGACLSVMGWAAALALVAGILLVGFAALNIVATRRTIELGGHMPGFLDRVRQLLVVGNSLPVAFVRAAQGGSPRLAAFFAPTMRRITNGGGFSDSIRQCAEDADLYEMRLFSVAIATNMRFGGSLTHALANLVSYMRKRASIERELRASTAQIRTSAIVLALLPIVVGSVIVFQNQEYARWFINHPSGRMMLLYCVGSQLAGLIVMRLIVRTRF